MGRYIIIVRHQRLYGFIFVGVWGEGGGGVGVSGAVCYYITISTYVWF